MPAKIAEQVDPLPLGDEAAGPEANGVEPAPLPPNGIIEPKGPLSEYEGCPDVPCSCETVTLARVETMDFTGWSGGLFGTRWGIFEGVKATYQTATQFELGDDRSPPESGPLEIPERHFMDKMCFYFTYPPCYAYWGREGGHHPCKVMVEIQWPSAAAASPSGTYSHTWQLYGIRGVENFATGAPNYICYVSSPEGFEVIPGSGHVRWSVNGRICEPQVEFTVVPH